MGNPEGVGAVGAGMTFGVNVRARTVWLLPALLLPALVGCGGSADPAAPVELEVVVQDWTGWQEEQPSPETRTEVVSADDTFTVLTTVGEITVTVVEIDDDRIELETSREMAPESDGGGIDLTDLETRFSLDRGGSTEFSTDTLDAGTTVTVTERPA